MYRNIIYKIFLSIATVMCLSIISICNVQASQCTKSDAKLDNTPSDQFIELYTNLFEETETYVLYDAEGECISEWFLDEYTEAYEKQDFQLLWDTVLANDYSLSFEDEDGLIMATSSTSQTVYSAWTYKLVPMNGLLNGKTIEFIYRISGTYSTNGSTITSCSKPTLQYNMTYPGDAFPYTVSYSTRSATINSTSTRVTFTLSFRFNFEYVYLATTQSTPYYSTTIYGTPIINQ